MTKLEAIKERAAKATPGPWVRDGTLLLSGIEEVDLRGPTYDDWYTVKSSRPDEDADFIAHAREDVPWLVGEVERLQALLGKIRRNLRGASEFIEGEIREALGEGEGGA